MTATSRHPSPSQAVAPDVMTRASRAARVAQCSWRLYDAECAVHAAHQTHVSEWIAAADAKLHDAVTDYTCALDAVSISEHRR